MEQALGAPHGYRNSSLRWSVGGQVAEVGKDAHAISQGQVEKTNIYKQTNRQTN